MNVAIVHNTENTHRAELANERAIHPFSEGSPGQGVNAEYLYNIQFLKGSIAIHIRCRLCMSTKMTKCLNVHILPFGMTCRVAVICKDNGLLCALTMQ